MGLRRWFTGFARVEWSVILADVSWGRGLALSEMDLGGALTELVMLCVYVTANALCLSHLSSRDWSALWYRYGDTPAYWDTLLAHMHACQLMIVHPIGVAAAWLIGIAVFRREAHPTTVLVPATLILVEVINISRCWYDALGVGV